MYKNDKKYRKGAPELVKSPFPFSFNDVYVNMVEALIYKDDTEYKALEDEYKDRFLGRLDRKKYNKIVKKPYFGVRKSKKIKVEIEDDPADVSAPVSAVDSSALS